MPYGFMTCLTNDLVELEFELTAITTASEKGNQALPREYGFYTHRKDLVGN